MVMRTQNLAIGERYPPPAAVDVCVVSRRTPPELEDLLRRNVAKIPCHHLIIERSVPLGLARKRAIAQVDTPWFVFLDDDMILGASWWRDMERAVRPGVGALTGVNRLIGLGPFWDASFNQWIEKQVLAPREVQVRAYTNNTLMRTDLVRDWNPSNPYVQTYEDYELTQHVRTKGFMWLEVPAIAYHRKTWLGLAKNALWAARTKKLSSAPSPKHGELATSLIWMVKVLFDRGFPLPVKVIVWWQHAFLVLGEILA